MDPSLSESADTGRSARAVAVAGLGVPFALAVYLGFAGGGYDGVVYGQVGILCWLAVLLGALAGVLPIARPGAGGWVMIAVLGGLAVWTATGLAWTDSSERTVAELARVASFLGVLCLAVSIQGRGALRNTVFALAAALALVSVMALLSRLHPELFPQIEAAAYLDDVEARLSYPVGYWNGLASLMAIGIPLFLCVALAARRRGVRALALAVVPIAALTAYFTLSRGGLFEVAVGLAAFLALYPRRLVALASTTVAVAGSGVLIAIASRFDALEDGVDTATAISEGNKLLIATVVVCALVAAGQLWIWKAAPKWRAPAVPRRVLYAGGAVLVAAALAVAAGASVPGKIADRIDEFTQAEAPEPAAGASRYESLSGNGRYQLWSSAVDAAGTDPVTGIGPGTFEFWWAQDRPIDAYARSAHSLYLNSLAEIGVVGLGIVLGFVLVPLGVGIARWRRAGSERPLYAGALAAAIVFAVAAGVDRTWDLAVLPVIFILLAAALTAAPAEGDSSPPGRAPPLALAGVTIVALLSIAAIALPVAGVQAVRESQADVRDDDLDGALEQARRASEIQPYAATPKYQEAQVLELQGELDAAAHAARVATDREPTNWHIWFVLARIEDAAGHPAAARSAYERSRSLNPLSDLFADN